MDVALIIIIVFLLAALIFIATRQNQKPELDKALNQLLEKSEEQRLKNKDEVNGSVKDMLENNQKQVDLIVRQLREQLKDSQGDVKSLKEQGAALHQAVADTHKVTEDLRTSTEGLRSLLSNNRLRGEWGEQVAEELLVSSGFVLNKTYTKQSNTKEGRPDYTVLMPDGTKLNVDVKFPYDGLVEYQEAKTNTEKKTALKKFENAIKNKVKEITTKDYINPEDQTMDFVVMFIPNEMIFSFIYEKLPVINDYCSQRKVVMAGPFGFTALLRIIFAAYKNFQYERGLQDILGLIEKFQSEYEKFGDSMTRLGAQIETTRKTFGEVETTRHRQLTRVVDKIGEYSKNEQQLLDKPKEDR